MERESRKVGSRGTVQPIVRLKERRQGLAGRRALKSEVGMNIIHCFPLCNMSVLSFLSSHEGTVHIFGPHTLIKACFSDFCPLQQRDQVRLKDSSPPEVHGLLALAYHKICEARVRCSMQRSPSSTSNMFRISELAPSTCACILTTDRRYICRRKLI